MAGADRAPPERRPQLDLELGRERERSLGAHQNVREIVARIVRRGARHQGVEIVAADPALHLGESRGDLVGFAGAEGEKIAGERRQRRSRRKVAQVGRDRAEMRRAAVGHHRVDRKHVVAHGAVAQRTAAARIVGRHAADGGARSGRDVDRKPQAVGFEHAIEIIKHDAGLDHASPARHVELEHTGEMPRAIDHERVVDGLSALRGAAAAGQHADAFLACDRDRALGIGYASRHDDADRHHLIVRRVGRVAAAIVPAEQHVARDLGLQPPLQPGHYLRGHALSFSLSPQAGERLRGLTAYRIRLS